MGRSASFVIVAIFIMPGCMGSQSGDLNLIGTEYRDPPEAPDFTLKNQHGEDVSLSDFDGDVVVVAFIYTSCPDVCLVISSNLAYVNDNLGKDAMGVEIISITIDPARDTVSRLFQWTESRGYEWNHLTHERGSVINSVWESWNVVVDAEHIANSLPPDGVKLRFAVLFPDNSTLVVDSECDFSVTERCFDNGTDFAERSLSGEGLVPYDISSGTIGNWTSNDSWEWGLYSWDSENESWLRADASSLDSMEVMPSTNLAWAASNANLSKLPPGFDCNGHGWVMGLGTSAHCMCDEGYERDGDDWLSCNPSAENNGNGTSDLSHSDGPHEDSLMQYEVGHSTVTFILDKEHRKRVAYSGIAWSPDDFLHDVIALSGE